MAYRIEWSPKAAEDIETIALYISADSTAYAAAIVKKFLDTIRSLSRFPFSGRVVPEFDDENVREKIVHGYRIIYRIQVKTVTIAAVLHGRRLLESDMLS